MTTVIGGSFLGFVLIADPQHRTAALIFSAFFWPPLVAYGYWLLRRLSRSMEQAE